MSQPEICLREGEKQAGFPDRDVADDDVLEGVLERGLVRSLLRIHQSVL